MPHGVPTPMNLALPTLRVLDMLGGSGTNPAIEKGLGEYLDLPESVRRAMHKNGGRTQLGYDAAWARTYLTWMEAVVQTGVASWVLTARGQEFVERAKRHENTVGEAIKAFVRIYRREKDVERAEMGLRQRLAITVDDGPVFAEEPEQYDTDDRPEWQRTLIDEIERLPRDSVEGLVREVLLASEADEVDFAAGLMGPIDGVASLGVDLLATRVGVRVVRDEGMIRDDAIREFRASISEGAGRADKGLFITTGRFTRDAREEAARDGAIAIDLIDGERLCHILKDLDLGVRTETVEQVTVDAGFFETLRP